MAFINDVFPERRSAPRFTTSLRGELATGEALYSVRFGSISTSGCSVAVIGAQGAHRPDLGPTGILHVSSALGAAPSAILPVRVMTSDPAENSPLIRLQFLITSPRQTAKLAAILAVHTDQVSRSTNEVELRSVGER